MPPYLVPVTFFLLVCGQGIFTAENILIENSESIDYIAGETKKGILQGSTAKSGSANVIRNIESTNDVLTKLIQTEKGLRPRTPAVPTGQKLGRYEPTWESINSRPLPAWYDDVKVGIFIHWGVFSVPSYRSEWFWKFWENPNSPETNFMKKNYPPGFTYQDFAKDFTTEFFDPIQWAHILASSGAKYVVLTSKHHEGYTLWPSKYSFSWNSMDVGPKRDLVGELATAIRKLYPDIHFGLYHSLFEWFNPLYVIDEKNNYTTDQFVLTKALPELIELVQTYKPEVIWSDGSYGPAEYWKSREFLAWLYNESPVKDTVVVNDRWCITCTCENGGFLTCEDKYNPGKLLARKFENCFTLDRYSWGYRRIANINDILNMTEVLETMMGTLSFGGNVLINIGPTKEGTISPIFQERLRDIGKFLKINGEAVYGSQPWKTCQNETLNNVTYAWYTTKTESNQINLYATFTKWPKNDELILPCVSIVAAKSSVYLLGYDEQKYSLPLVWDQKAKGITVHLPKKSLTTLPWAWVLKIVNIKG